LDRIYGMSSLSLSGNPKALEAQAAGAGLALACSYSSSDEYEAEVIRIRREAGLYGSRRPAMAMIVAVLVGSAMVLALASALFCAG
jgi:hypothetical protein